MLCGDTECGCAISSSTLSISGSGIPADPWEIETAESSDLNDLIDAVAVLTERVDNLDAGAASQSAAIAHLQAQMANRMAFRRHTTLSANSVTVAPGPATLHSLLVPAPGVGGTVFAWATALGSQTVSGSVFQLAFNQPHGTDHAPARFSSQGGALSVSTIAMDAFGIPANGATDFTVSTRIARIAGTGSLTVNPGSWARLNVLVIPGPMS